MAKKPVNGEKSQIKSNNTSRPVQNNVPKNAIQNTPRTVPQNVIRNAPQNAPKTAPKAAGQPIRGGQAPPKKPPKKVLKNTKKQPPKKTGNTPRNSPQTVRQATARQQPAARADMGQAPARSANASKAPAARNSAMKAPPKPVNKKSQAAVASAMRKRETAAKRNRTRTGNYILYYLFAGLVAAVVLSILANTVLFNCKEIAVSGNVRYETDEIISVSGLRTGDNLLHVDTEQAAESIVGALAYIDAAAVRKSYPTKLVISVTEAEKWYCIYQNGVYAAISRGGKIIETCAPDGLTVVRGFEAETVNVGSKLISLTESKTDIPGVIFAAAEKAGLKDIDEIDLSDRFSIKMTVDGRIFMELGSVTDIESKLIVAQKLIATEISSAESVTMLLTNPEMVAVSPIHPVQPEDPTPDGTDGPEDGEGDGGEGSNSGDSDSVQPSQ